MASSVGVDPACCKTCPLPQSAPVTGVRQQEHLMQSY